MEFDDKQQQSYKKELSNLRVPEWLNEMTSDPKEIGVTTQDANRESLEYINIDKHGPSWAAQKGPLFIPVSNLKLIKKGYAIDGDVEG